MISIEDEYIKTLGFNEGDDIVSKIKILSSDLSDEEHIIRSCIFDMHAIIERLLKEVFKKTFSCHLFFIDGNEEHNESIVLEQEKALDKLSFIEIWRCLKPSILRWSSDFASIEEINKTRNQAAHGNIKNVLYKNRNPFEDKDCLAQMFFDTWAITQELPKYTYFTTEKDKKELQFLRKRVDELEKEIKTGR